jgi:hypothetical protein
MKTSMALFTGAILASSLFAGGNGVATPMSSMNCKHACCRPADRKAITTADPGAAERFQMKFGRQAKALATEVYAKNAQCDRKKAKPAAAVAAADPAAAERLRMKFGRTPATAERPVELASAEPNMCAAGCCTH